ncbi:MAG: FHA domain-containing protein [Gammaproteobacteria bacterium]|nr:FHA domain-containing protein [Gammaproteobacteria bacterium]
MTILGIDLNDAAIAVVGGGIEPAPAPGYALARDGGMLFGLQAWRQARLHPRQSMNQFWRQLSEQPLSKALKGYASSADLVHAQLEQISADFPADLEGVIFAVPAYWTPAQLGLLLGIALELAIPVRGLVDSAIAATRREYPGRDLLHLDISLHDLTVTRIMQDGRSALGDRWTMEQCGVVTMERACAEYIAEHFVESTRFDPLHDARSEQYLYDNLHAWLAQLSRQAHLDIAIEFGGNEFSTVIERTKLQERLVDRFSPVTQQMRSLFTAGKPFAIQVDQKLANFPGLVESIARLSQVAVFVLEPAAAAWGALRRAGHFAQSDGGVSLTTALQWDQKAVPFDEESRDALLNQTEDQEHPTHLLYDGRAYQLGTQTFYIGTELSSGAFGVCVPEGTGVSRRHCSIRMGDHGVELIDHSRYGTRLNGHAIGESAVLHIGDVLSIGQPASVFHLIAEVTAGASHNGT